MKNQDFARFEQMVQMAAEATNMHAFMLVGVNGTEDDQHSISNISIGTHIRSDAPEEMKVLLNVMAEKCADAASGLGKAMKDAGLCAEVEDSRS